MARFALVLVAACGGSNPPAKTIGSIETGSATPSPSATKGSTGVANLAWGASAEIVKAAFPTARALPKGGLQAIGNPDGIGGITSFLLGTMGLERINIDWTPVFPTMSECMKVWRKLRGTYDARFAVASQSANGAAYWNLPTVDVTIACNPNETGTAALSANFVPPPAAE
ncbi:hypothetical protein BH11MYX1_BH11MYX1_25080 [soil metagenome]